MSAETTGQLDRKQTFQAKQRFVVDFRKAMGLRRSTQQRSFSKCPIENDETSCTDDDSLDDMRAQPQTNRSTRISEIIPRLMATVLPILLSIILSNLLRKSTPETMVIKIRPSPTRNFFHPQSKPQPPTILSRILALRRQRRATTNHFPRKPWLPRLSSRKTIVRRKTEVIGSIKGFVDSEMISVLAVTSLFFSFLRPEI